MPVEVVQAEPVPVEVVVVEVRPWCENGGLVSTITGSYMLIARCSADVCRSSTK